MLLLQMSFYGAFMILVVLITRMAAINKLPKNLFLLLWEIILLRLLIPFSFNASSWVADKIYIKKAQAADSFIIQSELVKITRKISGISEALESHGVVNAVLVIIWIMGMFFCFIFFAVTYVRFYIEFQTSLPVNNEAAAKWLAAHKLRRSISIRESDRISTPLTYGIIKPVILMPKNTDWENTGQLEYILLHEYIHICRFDMLIKLLAILVLCMHWFNPFVWLMCVMLNRDIELACDEGVILKTGEASRREYSRMLIGMEEKKQKIMIYGNGFGKNAIEERIRSIMKSKKRTMLTTVISVIFLTAMIIFFTVAAPKDIRTGKEEVMYVNENAVRVRSGAGNEYDIIAMLKTDTSVKTVHMEKDKNGEDWYKIDVNLEDGESLSGYIRADLLSK